MDGALIIEDLGSSNKTRIVGGPILTKGEQHRITPGMSFQLGKAVLEVVATSSDPPEKSKEVVRSELAAPAAPAAPEPPPPETENPGYAGTEFFLFSALF